MNIVNLSTPSLGITEKYRKLMEEIRQLTFNSLSRDHMSPCRKTNRHIILSTPSLGITCRAHISSPDACTDFQLPLSGSHEPETSRPVRSMPLTFNSLSRDHSTAKDAIQSDWIGDFQLPLSGSQFPSRFGQGTFAQIYFQLPLSGSQCSSIGRAGGTRGSFNSLSRDHTRGRDQRDERHAHFQLPLSGSQSLIRLCIFSRTSLSTPSLGITDVIIALSDRKPLKPFNSLSRDHLRQH